MSDKALDLRQCNYKGANLSAKVLSGAFMSDADFSNANMRARSCHTAAWRSRHYFLIMCFEVITQL